LEVRLDDWHPIISAARTDDHPVIRARAGHDDDASVWQGLVNPRGELARRRWRLGGAGLRSAWDLRLRLPAGCEKRHQQIGVLKGDSSHVTLRISRPRRFCGRPRPGGRKSEGGGQETHHCQPQSRPADCHYRLHLPVRRKNAQDAHGKVCCHLTLRRKHLPPASGQHGAYKCARSRIVNVVSHQTSELSAIHVRSPPDRP
jgi:hypothetical protein